MFDQILNYFRKKNEQTELNSKKAILIVDDDEIDRKLIKKIVDRQNYRVLLAENGEVGLQIARDEKPDLIVLDCQMPVMGGLEMCRRLKNDTAIAHIPVLFLTSNDTPKNVIECFEVDAANYLSKPVNAKILTSHIETILAEKSSK